MRKAYSPAQIAEAVSLATIVGAEAAARQLGIDPRTIRGWMERAGKAPADALTSPDWQQLGDLARSQVAASLASGKVRPKDAAVIAAIASRNAAKPPTELDPETDEDEQFWAALVEQFGDHAHLALIASIRRMEDEPDADAKAVWEWVTSIPDLPAWREERMRADHDRMEAQLELNRQAAAAFTQRALDSETEALIAQAEAYLTEHVA